MALFFKGDFKLSVIYIPVEGEDSSGIVDLEAKFASGPFVYWDSVMNRLVEDNIAGENPLLALKDITDIVLGNGQNIRSEILVNACDHK